MFLKVRFQMFRTENGTKWLTFGLKPFQNRTKWSGPFENGAKWPPFGQKPFENPKNDQPFKIGMLFEIETKVYHSKVVFQIPE